jgi:HD-like signal output (HDOD) protein
MKSEEFKKRRRKSYKKDFNIRQKLREILDRTEDLPSIPIIAVKIYKLCSSSEVSKERLEELLKSDQSIVARLLRTVNSAYYGFPQNIESLVETINILGIKGIQNAVMVSVVDDAFKYPGGKVLWKDSVEASLVIENIFKYFKTPSSDYQLLTGLLHNIGRSVFSKFFPEENSEVLGLRVLEEIYEAEREIFGMDHRDCGAILAKNWDLPINVVSGIQGNHTSMSEINYIDTALKITYSTDDDLKYSFDLSHFLSIKKDANERIQAMGVSL